ncbi:MAG: bifunctional pyr operon transcriptional regulator/uracil phosphoribosyltransferase PyrR [Clostridia bacterium]|nr:bifunctional pyr operon transcriptional regulator/uracil phosphoribosyltransferase PyrR [Clostridia bacterium]
MENQIMDEMAVERSLARITHEIIEKNKGVDNVILLGVKTRGVPLAYRLAKNIKKFEDADVPVGELDITCHRDDIPLEKRIKKDADSVIPCALEGKTAVIVDDVLYTGRTARAAIEAVFSFGRPSSVQFAVLVDRGHRELPIRPDYVCKNIPTSQKEKVDVRLSETDGETGVYIIGEK